MARARHILVSYLVDYLPLLLLVSLASLIVLTIYEYAVPLSTFRDSATAITIVDNTQSSIVDREIIDNIVPSGFSLLNNTNSAHIIRLTGKSCSCIELFLDSVVPLKVGEEFEIAPGEIVPLELQSEWINKPRVISKVIFEIDGNKNAPLVYTDHVDVLPQIVVSPLHVVVMKSRLKSEFGKSISLIVRHNTSQYHANLPELKVLECPKGVSVKKITPQSDVAKNENSKADHIRVSFWVVELSVDANNVHWGKTELVKLEVSFEAEDGVESDVVDIHFRNDEGVITAHKVGFGPVSLDSSSSQEIILSSNVLTGFMIQNALTTSAAFGVDFDASKRANVHVLTVTFSPKKVGKSTGNILITADTGDKCNIELWGICKE